MSEPQITAKAETETSLYAGAIATFVIALLPYVNVFILPAYVVGAVVAVWHAAAVRGQSMQFKNRARLGFLSTFFRNAGRRPGGSDLALFRLPTLATPEFAVDAGHLSIVRRPGGARCNARRIRVLLRSFRDSLRPGCGENFSPANGSLGTDWPDDGSPLEIAEGTLRFFHV